MLLKTVFIRFYKSFNFDYLRKFHDGAKPMPWEMIDKSLWYPHVRIPIDPQITTMVGANESGKTHLLTAIEKGITGRGIEREDFCRYSEFYSVERGKWQWPDFGFEWANLTEAEQLVVQTACGVPAKSFDRFLLFRTNREQLTVYIPSGDTFASHDVKAEKASELIGALPRLFRIAANVALPESVPTRYLASSDADAAKNRFGAMRRRQRFDFLEKVNGVLGHSDWFSSAQAVTQQAQPIASAMSTLFSSSTDGDASGHNVPEVELARKLIYQVAGIDQAAIDDLYRALKEGKDGHANGLIQEINNHLAASLNFPKWWVQDKDFRLTVSSRDHDLVFTIRDRTGTEYSFSERSDGLKYFLSYYVQYRAHEPMANRAEILLMDEPDTYLSAQAQQDLLRIFDAFARPEGGQRPIQVVYVTHSPFLIDKNHSERIRVLEKGVGDEGTRVVKDASRNHYEPLRSAFGAFVGETTFIGNCNLMVEGSADQIMLAGAAANLRAGDVGALETLDLNRVTIVPTGSASQIPYLVYLARGRDIEQPAVIVLIDSDEEGNQARKRLKRGGAYNKQLLKDEFVLQLADLAKEPGFQPPEKLVETEDLVPVALAVAATQKYATEVCGLMKEHAERITAELISGKLNSCGTMFKSIEAALSNLNSDSLHITKIGFARNVVEIASNLAKLDKPEDDELRQAIRLFESRMKVLFRKLNVMRRSSERERADERVSQRIGRARQAFLQDHPSTAIREQAHVLFEDMAATLDPDSIESDAVRFAIQKVRREFEIDVDMTKPIANFDKFRQALESIRYAARQATQEEPGDEMPPSSVEVVIHPPIEHPVSEPAIPTPMAKSN
jgi:predicted ATPase